jgi:hypothetical protein
MGDTGDLPREGRAPGNAPVRRRSGSRVRRAVLPIPPPPAADIFDVRVFLGPHSGRAPEEIHAKLQTGDPLGIHGLGMSMLREEAYLIDPDRLRERALACIAHSASRATREDLGPEWLQGCVALAIRRILTEDQEDERASAGAPPADDTFYRFIHLAFATERGLVRSAAVRFNTLPKRARYAFFRMLVDGIPVDDCIREHGGTHEEVRQDVLSGLRALGHILEGEVVGSSSRRKKKEEQG